jgi:L-serine/L-threonine ammonia-lyase
MEAWQPTGSFKIRGLGRACELAVRAGARRLYASSGGNAGLAVAYAGARLDVPVKVFVPRATPPAMLERIRSEGAEVELRGDSWDDAHAHAVAVARAEGAAYVHPFDEPAIWDGHSSMIDEVEAEGVRPGAVVVAVGGGGLLVGVVRGMQRAGWSDVPVLAVETEGAASFAAALRAGEVVTLPALATVAKSLGARRVAEEALALARHHPIEPWTVTDRAAVRACRRFADDHRTLVEPACGAALAAAYDRAAPLVGRGPVLVIVCGGSGVTLAQLAEWERAV